MVAMNPILEKIKKLLRMKRGGTPDEVATALRLAQELAEKHGIDLSGVNPDDDNTRPERPISHTDQILGARVQWECRYAALICHNFFNVNTFVNYFGSNLSSHRWGFTFVGTAWDTEIAIYVYQFLTGHFRREWKARGKRLRNRRAFMWGMYIGLAAKLRDRQPKPEQKPGLIATERQLQRRQDYITKHFGDLKKNNAAPDDDADAARYAGIMAGRETEIRSGVTGSDTKTNYLPAPGVEPRLLLT